jgi:hypothetical protein
MSTQSKFPATKINADFMKISIHNKFTNLPDADRDPLFATVCVTVLQPFV